MTLMMHKQLLQQELEGWTDWASVKVREAAQKLSKEQPELRMLRQEREETHNFEALMEEKVKQRQSELEAELSDFHSQMRVSNSAVQRLEAERAKLKKGIRDCRFTDEKYTVFCKSEGNCGEGAGVTETVSDTGEQHEERDKIKNLQKLESIRSKREQWKRQQFRGAREVSNANGNALYAFLPCAHQVLCKDCNTLHENQGMKDCPSCRTPIVQRIHARFPPRRPH
nr:putative E3 ubiquitin-protein ligase RF298 [Ipomoea trifida]